MAEEGGGVDLNSQICRMTITIIITITIKTQLQQPQLQDEEEEEEEAEETLQRQQQQEEQQHREFYKQQNVQLTTYNKKVVSTNSQSCPCVCECVYLMRKCCSLFTRKLF